MIVPFVAFPLVALLLAVLSQLGGNGRLRRNGLAGLRIPSTMSSDRAWRAGHRAAAVPAWIGFVAVTVISVISLLLFGAGDRGPVGTAIVSAALVGVIIWVIAAASRAARAAEAATSRQD